MFSLTVSHTQKHTHECKHNSCSLQGRAGSSWPIPICLPRHLVSVSVYLKINVVSVCLYVFKTQTPMCVCERRRGSDTFPLRLIESFRRENRPLKRKHKALLPCYNKPVRGRQMTHAHTHAHTYDAHTQLSNVRVIGWCVCEKTSVPWLVEIPKALAKTFSLPAPSL